MFSIPAIALSSSVACRSFVRLSEFAAPVDRSNQSGPWTQSGSRLTGRSKDVGKTSTIQWARPQQEGMGGISVTRSQHVDIGMEPYNIHPLEASGDSLQMDQKAGFAV